MWPASSRFAYHVYAMSTRAPLRHIEIDSAAQIPEMTRRIVDAFSPAKIILFGSQARHDAKPDSDVDLLVVLDHVDDKRKAVADILALSRDLIVSVDVVVTTPEEIARRGDVVGSILRPALREGMSLYVR